MKRNLGGEYSALWDPGTSWAAFVYHIMHQDNSLLTNHFDGRGTPGRSLELPLLILGATGRGELDSAWGRRVLTRVTNTRRCLLWPLAESQQ